MYKSSSHSFCQLKARQLAEANSRVLFSEQNIAERAELNCKDCYIIARLVRMTCHMFLSFTPTLLRYYMIILDSAELSASDL